MYSCAVRGILNQRREKTTMETIAEIRQLKQVDKFDLMVKINIAYKVINFQVHWHNTKRLNRFEIARTFICLSLLMISVTLANSKRANEINHID